MLPGMDQRTPDAVQVAQLAQAHLVQAGDLVQVVAPPDGVDGRHRPFIPREAQLLSGVDHVAGEVVDGLQLDDGQAVGLGDLPQGVAPLDHVHRSAHLPQAQLLAHEDPVAGEVVDAPQRRDRRAIESGDAREVLAPAHHVDGLVAGGLPQAQPLARVDAAAAQVVQAAQRRYGDAVALGDGREVVAAAHHVHVGIGRGDRQALARVDPVAAQAVPLPEFPHRDAVLAGDGREGLAARDPVRPLLLGGRRRRADAEGEQAETDDDVGAHEVPGCSCPGRCRLP